MEYMSQLSWAGGWQDSDRRGAAQGQDRTDKHHCALRMSGSGLLDIIRDDVYSRMQDYVSQDEEPCALAEAKRRFQRNYLADMIGYQQYGNIKQIAQMAGIERESCSRLIKDHGLTDLVNHYRIESNHLDFSLDKKRLDEFYGHRQAYDRLGSAIEPYGSIVKEEVLSDLEQGIVSRLSGTGYVDYLSSKVFDGRKGRGEMDYKSALAEFETLYLGNALMQAGYDKHKAAERLGVDVRTVERKILEFGIDAGDAGSTCRSHNSQLHLA